MSAVAWILLMMLSVVWGGSFFFNAVILRELGPFGVVFGRVFLGFLILLALVKGKGLRLDIAANWKAFLMMGLLNYFVPFNLIVYGQTFIDSGPASIFNATTPFFAVALAFFLARDEDIGVRKLIGVIIGVAGVSVLLGIGAEGLDTGALFGGTMVMAGSFSYALAGIFGRRFGGMAPEVSACGMLMFAALLCVGPAAYHDGANFARLSWTGVAALVGIAGLSTAFAYILYFQILKMAGAVNLLLVTLLIPISATLLGLTFLNESIGSSEVMGMAIIGLGLLVVDWRILGCFLRKIRQFKRHETGQGSGDS